MPTLQQVKNDPSLVDQIRGCCGFAAAIMALLVRKSTVLDELADCVSKGTKFKSIDATTKVKSRLQKRAKVGIIADIRDDDFVLCLALMIIFKEYAKQNSLGDWQECLDFSQVWSEWQYAGMEVQETDTSLLRFLGGGDYSVTTSTTVTKLKDVPEGKKLGSGLVIDGFSYKRGDLGVPGPNMTTLLDMVGLTVKRQGPLVNTSTFRTFKGQGSGMTKLSFLTFLSEVRTTQLAGSASSVDYEDIILGVGNRPRVAGFEAYDNVTHWVYVPVKPNNKPSSGEFKCWTWGGERDFWSYMTEDRKFYPAYAIYLE